MGDTTGAESIAACRAIHANCMRWAQRGGGDMARRLRCGKADLRHNSGRQASVIHEQFFDLKEK
jgi:hypothetical protein